MKDRIEICGGMIAKGPDAGQRVYFVSAIKGGTECVLLDTNSNGRAIVEAVLIGVEWGLPVHDLIAGKSIGGYHARLAGEKVGQPSVGTAATAHNPADHAHCPDDEKLSDVALPHLAYCTKAGLDAGRVLSRYQWCDVAHASIATTHGC